MANSNGAYELGKTPPPASDTPSDQAQISATTTQLTAANINAAPMSAANTNRAPALDAKAEETLRAEKKQKRTAGLKLLDLGLYPILNNFAVFAVSVAATYITQNKATTYTGFRGWLQGRGKKFTDFATKHGMSKNSADNASMVAFSFIDGSIMAPLVKVIEDRREPIAKRIDDMLGTTPQDMSVYDAEPKQSWTSLVLGRVATLGIVLPVAVGLDKTGQHMNKKWGVKKEGEKDFNDLNSILFRNPGQKLGQHLEKTHPSLKQKFADVPLLFRTAIFESFYTSVCTAGLYFSSRFFARKQGERHEHKTHPSEAPRTDAPTPAPIEPPVATRRDVPEEKHATTQKPATYASEISHQDRIARAPEQAIGASA